MNVVLYISYWVNIVDADGLVLQHRDVFSKNSYEYLIILLE